jgi:hypothetical protein
MQHSLTRFIVGFLSGLLGMLAGWVGLAACVMAVAGPDRDGGLAMGAFFNIGPLGGVVGFAAGVLLFLKLGQVSPNPSSGAPAGGALRSARKSVSPVFAALVLVVTAGLGWWGWYEFIRSPYLTHGFMTLELQFRLPAGAEFPPDASEVHVTVEEGEQTAEVSLGRRWRGTDGDRRVILASASLMRKTSRRIVTLELPGAPEQTWRLDLASDPDPMTDYSSWRFPLTPVGGKIEMNFRLTSDR